MSRARRLGLPALLLLASLSSCSAPSPSERRAEQSAAIIDGELSGTDEDGVVLLRAVPGDVPELVCSGTLVAPNLVITARHCVSYFTEGYFDCSPRGELIDSTDNAGQLGLHFDPKTIEVYGGHQTRTKPLARGSQIISTLSETICLNDVAFIVLDAPVDLPIVPMRLGRPAQVGEAALLVGFGLDADQSKLDFRTQPRHHKVVEIADVGPDSLADGVVRAPPRTLILQGPSGCIGDSGGPLLDQETGALLGVYSLQQGDSCSLSTIRHYLVHVPPFELLIGQAFAAAGAEPLREPEPPAQGGAGGADGSGGEPSAAAGAGGAADEAAPQRASHGSGCAITAPSGEARALEGWLALGALATAVQRIRRRHGRRRSGRRRFRG